MTRYSGQSLIMLRKEETINNNEQTFEYLLKGGRSNFNAVVGGVREKGKGKNFEYKFLDNLGYYWTSTKNENKEAWFYGFSNLPEVFLNVTFL